MVSAVLLVLGALLLAAFVISYIREPRRLRTGVFLLLAVASLVLGLLYLNGTLAQQVVSAALPILAVLMLVGYVAIVSLLVINGFLVVKREGLSLPNLLPIAFAAVALLAPGFVVWVISAPPTRASIWLGGAAFFVFGVYAYFGLVFLSVILYAILYRTRHKNPEAPAVLILGSRIFNGKVPPLLASRLDRGVKVFNQRKDSGKEPPVMVCCGGQGPDEDRPEAAAMADYLLEQGIPEAAIRREEKSTTTRENLIFGSRIVHKELPGTASYCNERLPHVPHRSVEPRTWTGCRDRPRQDCPLLRSRCVPARVCCDHPRLRLGPPQPLGSVQRALRPDAVRVDANAVNNASVWLRVVTVKPAQLAAKRCTTRSQSGGVATRGQTDGPTTRSESGGVATRGQTDGPTTRSQSASGGER